MGIVGTETLASKVRNMSTSFNIGTIFRRQGKLPESQEMYEQAVAIQQKILGEHVNTAQSMMGISNVLGDIRKPNEALEKYTEVLLVQEKVLGPDHRTWP